MRFKLCVFLFFALFLPLAVTPAKADVALQRGDSVPNIEPGFCTWCSLETLANALKRKAPDDPSVKALIGLRSLRERDGGGPATPEIVRKQLSALGVKFQERSQALDESGRQVSGKSKDLDFLKNACQRDVGAMVGVYNFPKTGTWHAVAVLSISKEESQGGNSDYQVCFYDPNLPEKLCYWGLSDFMGYWTGWAVAIDLVEAPSVVIKPTKAAPVSPLAPAPVVNDLDLWSKIEADMAAIKKIPKAATPSPRVPAEFSSPKTHDELIRFLERTGLTPQEASRAAGNLMPGSKKGD